MTLVDHVHCFFIRNPSAYD